MLKKQYGIHCVTSYAFVQTCPNQAEGVLLSNFRYRITESSGLEGTSVGHQVQTPCQSRVIYSRLHRTLSRWVFNISKGDSTTSLGSLFQGSITLRGLTQTHIYSTHVCGIHVNFTLQIQTHYKSVNSTVFRNLPPIHRKSCPIFQRRR